MFANLIDNILTVVLICIHLLMRLIPFHVFKGHAYFFFSDLPVYAPFVILYYANLYTIRILTISLSHMLHVFFVVCNFFLIFFFFILFFKIYIIVWVLPNILFMSPSTVSPSISHEVVGPDPMIFVFWMLSFKPTFSLSSFTFIKRLF